MIYFPSEVRINYLKNHNNLPQKIIAMLQTQDYNFQETVGVDQLQRSSKGTKIH